MTTRLRISLVEKGLILSFLCAIYFSAEFWLGKSNFPVVGVLSIPFQKEVFVGCSVLLIALLGLRLVLREVKWHLRTITLLMLTISLLNFVSWQPWFYQYIFLFVLLDAYEGKYVNYNHYQRLLPAFQLIWVGIYLWSGIYKINPSFFSIGTDFFAYPVGRYLTKDLYQMISSAMVILPFLELVFGILLLWKRFNLIALVGLSLMHVYIIYTLSPLGIGVNYVVIPWNIFMIISLWGLFFNSGFKLKPLPTLKPNAWAMVSIFFFLILPMANFTGKYEAYFSFELYSGRNLWKPICAAAENWNYSKIPDTYLSKENNLVCLDYYAWSYYENNLPAPSNLLLRNALIQENNQLR